MARTGEYGEIEVKDVAGGGSLNMMDPIIESCTLTTDSVDGPVDSVELADPEDTYEFVAEITNPNDEWVDVEFEELVGGERVGGTTVRFPPETTGTWNGGSSRSDLEEAGVSSPAEITLRASLDSGQ